MKPTRAPPRLTPEEIDQVRAMVLHQDDHILALNKPAGLSSQGGRGQVHTLDELLFAFAKSSGARPRLVHRLDRDTSGIILTARTKPEGWCMWPLLMGIEPYEGPYGVVGFFDDWDVLITPSLAKLPVRHGEIDPLGDNPAYEFKKSGEFTPYTAGMNVTGQPAISLPLGQSEEGLPLGTHLIGRPEDEGTLLALSAQLEQARPWADRVAPELS